MAGLELVAGQAAIENSEFADATNPAMQIALAALPDYDLPPDCRLALVNISENVTFRVSTPDNDHFALRVHRPGYHSDQAIASELAWVQALRKDGAALTPIPLPGRDGRLVQRITAPNSAAMRRVVLFRWETGQEPAATDTDGFEQMGEQAALMHEHVQHWRRPAAFTRHAWTFETSLGERPHWGSWRDGLGMTDELASLFCRAIARIERRLALFGQGSDRFGLVHGDMRLANLLVDGLTLKVIDFDDCGFSWFLYDCATTVSFFEHEPQVPTLLAAWLRGYRRVRVLDEDSAQEIATFVLLRRLLLVAWLASHHTVPLARSLGSAYTVATAPMCLDYLKRFG